MTGSRGCYIFGPTKERDGMDGSPFLEALVARNLQFWLAPARETRRSRKSLLVGGLGSRNGSRLSSGFHHSRHSLKGLTGRHGELTNNVGLGATASRGSTHCAWWRSRGVNAGHRMLGRGLRANGVSKSSWHEIHWWSRSVIKIIELFWHASHSEPK